MFRNAEDENIFVSFGIIIFSFSLYPLADFFEQILFALFHFFISLRVTINLMENIVLYTNKFKKIDNFKVELGQSAKSSLDNNIEVHFPLHFLKNRCLEASVESLE